MIGGAPERVHNGTAVPALWRYHGAIVSRFPVMPIYVFRCSNCGEKFERLQKLSDSDPDVCPHCGKHDTVQRQVTAPAFRLSGSGWYETDFKSDREKKHNLAGDAAKPKEKPAEKPAESPKPAAEKGSKAAGD
jgi:putative FmdB family regulatory protein